MTLHLNSNKFICTGASNDDVLRLLLFVLRLIGGELTSFLSVISKALTEFCET